MKDWRPLLVPFVLICIGVMLLIGCIPIPATRQFQTNGHRRPEHLVGNDASDPVRVGHTSIVDAVVAISKTSGDNRHLAMHRWSRSADGKQFAYAFNLRTGTIIWPLCFYAQREHEARWIVLDVDESGTVTAARSTAERPAAHQRGLLDWSRELPEDARRQLQDASVLPNDFVLELMLKQEQRRRTPATQRGE